MNWFTNKIRSFLNKVGMTNKPVKESPYKTPLKQFADQMAQEMVENLRRHTMEDNPQTK